MNGRLHKPLTFAARAPLGERRRTQEAHTVILMLLKPIFGISKWMHTPKKYINARFHSALGFGAKETGRAGIVPYAM